MSKENKSQNIDDILDDIIINYIKAQDLVNEIESYSKNKDEFEADTIEEYITQILEDYIYEYIAIKSLFSHKFDIVHNYIENYTTFLTFKNVKITGDIITFTLKVLNRDADENVPKKIERQFAIDMK